MSTKPHGLIVQFANGWQLHFGGLSALVDAISYADEHATKVCVISNPNTIARDLEGSRAREQSAVGSKYRKSDIVFDAPEDRVLRSMGRLDLFERAEPPPRCWPVRMAIRRRRQQIGDE